MCGDIFFFLCLFVEASHYLCLCRKRVLGSQVSSGDLWRIALTQTSTQQLGELLLLTLSDQMCNQYTIIPTQ